MTTATDSNKALKIANAAREAARIAHVRLGNAAQCYLSGLVTRDELQSYADRAKGAEREADRAWAEYKASYA